MHPNTFVKEAKFKISQWDFGNVIDSEMKELLGNVHPLNILKTDITLAVYELVVTYWTKSNNFKRVKKYVILNHLEELELDSPELWTSILADTEMSSYKHNARVKKPKIESSRRLCLATLDIG